MNPRQKLKAIKDPVIIHYARSPFDDYFRNAIWDMFIWHNDEFFSFHCEKPDEETQKIKEFKQKIDSLKANGGTILHWNQISSEFGARHINNRYMELTGNELGLSYGHEAVNLAYEMVKIYGDEYVNHPRLDNLAKLNGWFGAERDEPCPLFDHKRTALIVKIFFGAINGTLKTMDSEYREKLLRTELLRQIKNELRDHDAEEKILTRKQVIEELDISGRTLTNWVSQSKIPYTRIGRRLYFLKSEILNLKY